eukprot:TRINITY_DN1631_c0_g1_i6.p1 TRINITY_DN1631_c0_g1~~TRINITY_DN1631_c0_g1_i6.p1  ORF type:complete len:262 (-),score=48.42 TRINITY_DN1631_c0_g1_i6:68-853(-)
MAMILYIALLACTSTMVNGVSADELPTVHLKLLPPAVSDSQALNRAEEKHKEALLDLTNVLEQAYTDTLSEIKEGVTSVVTSTVGTLGVGKGAHRGSSFLGSHGEAFDVKVNLLPAKTPAKVTQTLERLEHMRASSTKKLVEQACHEFKGLKKVILNELKARLLEASEILRRRQQRRTSRSSGLSFSGMRRLPPQANVRVSAGGEKWPMLSELVQDERRREDRADNELRAHILELESQLLEAGSNVARKALHEVLVDLGSR